ncbi:UPF0481 protein At3g47200-like [Durio zibethinus]|uniref:UPF0481 protein At3g47200-like n=1 Tax=Durio zibethinus TaxID=66656 RepID=A0A6P5X4Y8_DURZI|nr:UPF0481 protein At3g47200-like [Durio zibethinus]
MTSKQGYPREVTISMPEIEQQSDFISEERKKLKSASLEIPNRRIDVPQTTKPLIQRVTPLLISGIKENLKTYFEPRMVAFGPLHHGNPKFDPAERMKREWAALFIQENQTSDNALFLEIKAEIQDLRKCYKWEDIKDYDDDELAWMFLVDGCAVLHTVKSIADPKKLFISENVDLSFAQLDLFLLENQLPYRVLKILIGLTKEPRMWELSITKYMNWNLMTNIPSRIRSEQPEEEKKRQDYAHLLERLRTELFTGIVEKCSSGVIGKMLFWCGDSAKNKKLVLSIKDLKESGIQVSPNMTDNPRNISFHCNILGSLKMPCLGLDGPAASKFVNLVALEMCRDFDNDHAVSSYLWFISTLLQTPEDVKELRVRGVLYNFFGNDEEVVNLFNGISEALTTPNLLLYFEVMESIQRYCNSWLIRISSKYFSRNWSFLAFLGAIAGLLLSLLQTYFTIIQKK